MKLKQVPTILFFFGLLTFAIAGLHLIEIALSKDVFYLLFFTGVGLWMMSARILQAIKHFESRNQQIID
ncbi:hypothetical protein [Bacillus sp. PS06]|uniref:hypothetical protein n=1 Tax=Bacillus sp. PS06 TaxID=2764176 RepID=UPI00177D5106|nr:hypothetical protein [Bacillus sp. PS06]MBD8067615.1 hypothetical protein [Bacillus sp. PS06]